MQELRSALAIDTMQSQVEQAYRDFIAAVKNAWNELDEEALDISVLAVVGQMLQSASSLTAAAGMQLQQQRAMFPSN